MAPSQSPAKRQKTSTLPHGGELGEIAKLLRPACSLPADVEAIVLLFGVATQDPENDQPALNVVVQRVSECVRIVNAASKRAALVFVSLDNPEDAATVRELGAAHLTDGWHLIPPGSGEPEHGVGGVAQALAQRLCIPPDEMTELPLLVSVTAQSTNCSSRVLSAVMENPAGAADAFPWPKPQLQTLLLGSSILTANGKPANITGPCTVGVLVAYHPVIDEEIIELVEALTTVYKEKNASGERFELVFVALNMPTKESEGFATMLADYTPFRAQMPWCGVPLEDVELGADFMEAVDNKESFERQLCMASMDGGGTVRVLNPNAAGEVRRTPSGFPWERPLVRDLDEACEDDEACLNDTPVFILYAKDDGLGKEVQVVAAAEAEAGRGDTLHFFTAKQDGEMAEYFREMTAVDDDEEATLPAMVVYEMNKATQFLAKPEAPAGTVRQFVDMYNAGQLEAQLITGLGEEDEDEDGEEDL